MTFVGRARELSLLADRLDAAGRGEGGVVLIAGEPGIGKTRLMAEFAGLARHAAWLVLSGRAYDTEGMPAYLPLVEAVREHIGTCSDEELRRLVEDAPAIATLIPDLRGRFAALVPTQPLSPEAERFRLFEAVSDFFLRAAGSSEARGLLLCLDDLHWADPSTVALVLHLARRLQEQKLLLVGSYRPEEVEPGKPLFSLLADLTREGLADRVLLHRWTAAETAALVEAEARVKPATEVVSVIQRETDGNPFFVHEVVRELLSDRRDLTSAATAAEEWRLPGGVREVIGKRLSRLGADARRLLEAGAVLGDGFSLDLVSILCGCRPDELVHAQDEGLQAAMLREQGGAYSFGHPLIRRTVYDSLGIARRQALHLRAAKAMEAIDESRGIPAEASPAATAGHFLKAGALTPENAAKAASYCRVAGEQAEAQTAWAEATRHYEACLAFVEESRQTLAEDEADLLLALGRTAQNAAAWQLAWRSLKRAIDIYRGRGDRVGVARASLLAITQTSAENQEALRRDALAALGKDHPHLRAQLLAAYYTGSWSEEGERDCQEAAALALEHGYEDVEARLRDRASHKAITDLRFHDAQRLAREAYEAIDKLGGHLYALHHLVDLATVTLLPGELGPARDALLEALEYVEKRQLSDHSARVRAQLGWLAVLQCDFGRLASIVEPATGSNEDLATLLAGKAGMERDARPSTALASFRSYEDLAVLLARKAEMEGDARRALAILDGAKVGASGPVRASVALSAGDVDGAREALRQWLKVFQESAETIIFERVTSLALVGDCLAELGRPEDIAPVYARAATWTNVRTGFEGALDHVRGALALRLGLVDEAEHWYQTGRDWAAREACPVELGRCLQGLAAVAVRQRRRREALTLLDQAVVLFEVHGAKLYLDQAIAAREALLASSLRTLTYPDGLTEREVQVLRLIAGGQSNREVAEALVLSVRTVERHITNIYAKIGARGKADATAYALRNSLT